MHSKSLHLKDEMWSGLLTPQDWQEEEEEVCGAPEEGSPGRTPSLPPTAPEHLQLALVVFSSSPVTFPSPPPLFLSLLHSAAELSFCIHGTKTSSRTRKATLGTQVPFLPQQGRQAELPGRQAEKSCARLLRAESSGFSH